MPKTIFTAEELKGYFKGDITHHFYKESMEKADAMKVHADGLTPEKLLMERRPNEPQDVLDYRKKIFVPKTKPIIHKIINSLSKIRRSSDWSIRFDDIDRYTRIAPEDQLNQYTEKTFPYFESLTNWVFAVLLKQYLVDPNSLIFVAPLEFDVDETEYLRPFPVIFNSADVLDYVQEDYAVLRNPLGSVYYVKTKPHVGDSYYFITTERIMRYDQIDSKRTMSLKLDYEHGLPEIPVFRIGAVIAENEGNNFLHESRIASVLPELDEAIREYSDLQAGKVTSLYPERWELTNKECSDCRGTGKINKIINESPCQITCDTCQGEGYKLAGPYSKILIKPPSALEPGTQLPTPPAGYVEKDVEILKLQEEGVEKHIYNALSSINFEFLMESPLNQSGTAKEVDKDELNNTVHAIAEDRVRVMDNIYALIAFYRYGLLYSEEEILEMLPHINVPEKYDILSATHLEQELASAKSNKSNPVILNALEVEYANKKFHNDPGVRDLLKLILELDPLPNVTEDEKMSRLSNKGITIESYIISSNIHEFIQQAIEEDAKFAEKALKDKKQKMKQLAAALKAEMDEAAKTAMAVNQAVMDNGMNDNGEIIEETAVNG